MGDFFFFEISNLRMAFKEANIGTTTWEQGGCQSCFGHVFQ